MTTPQGPLHPPPDGYPTWLDYVTTRNDVWLHPDIYAWCNAELAALRKELENTKAERDAAKTDLECLTISGDMLASDTSLFRGNSVRYWYDKARAYMHAFSERDAALKELSDTQGLLATARENLVAIEAQRAEAVRERDALRKELDEAIGHLDDISSVTGHGLFLDDADHEAPHLPEFVDAIVKERDALRAQVAELREAIIGLDSLTSVGGGKLAMGALTCAADVQRFNDLVAKLIGESAPKEEKQP